MAGLQTSVGLISGIPIQDTVAKLIEIEAMPKVNLENRTKTLRGQQAAFVQLTALFNTTTYMMKNLGKIDVYTSRIVKSSNDALLKATKTGKPTDGNYSFTPVKMATAQSTLAQGVASSTTPLGQEGNVSIRFGRNLETNYALKDINGGTGFVRGYIRITDGSGTRTNIDLRNAQSMQDVLDAINGAKDIDVVASVEGDHLVLTDFSGGTGTLSVQEVNNGKTAESLGFKGMTAQGGVLKGSNILYLGAKTDISILNDGNGLVFDELLNDLTVTLADGTAVKLDFNPLEMGGTTTEKAQIKTVGDLVDLINAAGRKAGTTSAGAPKLAAGIRADGKGLVLVDNTTGSGSFKIAQDGLNQATGKPILYQLGLAQYGQMEVEVTGQKYIEGRAIIGDLDSALMSSLNGGRGFPISNVIPAVSETNPDGIALLAVQDRTGNRTYLSFSAAEFKSAETLEDWARLVNSKLNDVNLLNNDGSKIITGYEKYENGDPKYTLVNGAIPILTTNILDSSSTAPTGISWVYDKDEPTKVVGYQYVDSTKNVKFADDYEGWVKDALNALEPGTYPVLGADGKVKTTAFSSVDTSAQGTGVSTGPGGGKIVQFVVNHYEEIFDSTLGEIVPNPDYGKVVGYDYEVLGEDGNPLLDEEGDPIVEYQALTSAETAKLPSMYDTDYSFPVFVDGVVQTTPAFLVTSDTEPTYSPTEEGFTVTWTYDEDDPTQVIGYTLTQYKTVELNDSDAESVNAMLAEVPPKYPVFNAEKKLQYTGTKMNTVDRTTAESYEGIDWLYATEGDPDSGVIGYALGDGTKIMLTDEQKAALGSGEYPELDLKKIDIYKTGSIGLEIRVNNAKNGLEVVDTTGAFAEGIIFADTAGHVAAMLGFQTLGVYQSSVQGIDMALQTVSYNTKLSSLNGGAGVLTVGSMFIIKDSLGKSYPYIFDQERPETLGDIIDAINLQTKAKVSARLNDTGDGIVLYEFGGGTEPFSVSELGNNNIAQHLGIKTGAVTRTNGSIGALALNGSTTYTVKVEKTDSLDDIRKKLNELGASFQATIINDGSSNPYRLSITGTQTGASGQMHCDFSAIGLGSTVMTKAQDAVLVMGDTDNPNSVIITSKSNTVSGVIPGMTLTIGGVSQTPINVWTERSSVEMKASLIAFVDNYNKLNDLLQELTFIDVTAGEKGIFAMDPLLNRLRSEMSNLVLKSYNNLGPIRSLADIGVSLEISTYDAETGEMTNPSGGRIEFKEEKFDQYFRTNPDAIQEFFAKTQKQYNAKNEEIQVGIGVASQFEKLAKVYADGADKKPDSAALTARFKAMDQQINDNVDRIEFLDARLEAKRTILLKQFYAMESAMAKMQNDMQYISKLSSASSA
ncbi:MAG: flagellar filament capping protein FliD [Thermoguttaceae bacterium]